MEDKSEDDAADAAEGNDDGLSPMARTWYEVAPYIGIGWFFAVAVGLFTWLGWWLDRRLGTGNALLIGGGILGILVGFANFFKVVLQLDKRKGNR